MKKIKLKIANWVLKRNQKALKRKKAIHNLDNAQLVGVIFSLDDLNSYQTIKQFLDFLTEKNLRIITIGYCSEKEIPNEFVGHSRINIFTPRDLNWYYVPISPMVKKFMAQEFDILFDLTIEDQFPPKYVNNISKAQFKIGRESGYNKEHDLMIKIEDKQGLQYLAEQIKYYISRINKEE